MGAGKSAQKCILDVASRQQKHRQSGGEVYSDKWAVLHRQKGYDPRLKPKDARPLFVKYPVLGSVYKPADRSGPDQINCPSVMEMYRL